MKAGLCKKLIFYTFLALLLIQITVSGENTTSSPIKIDNHWIYIYQLDDLKTFEINEYFIINNTGEATFNDSIYIWIQNNSIISADCCNYILNMACRYNATGKGICFYLNKSSDSNLYFGHPILSENKLSYYGQKESFSVTAFSNKNTSLSSDTINLNATIGGISIPRDSKNFQALGVHLTSENIDVGMLPVIDRYMPFKIMTIENITIFNNVSDNEVIGFDIHDLPQGWNAEIWNDSKRLNNISLSPQEFVNLSLIITAPSNIASIYTRYTTQLETDGDGVKGLFSKQYLYETKKVTYEVYLSSIDELEVSNDLEMVHDELFWMEEYNRYWFIARSNDVYPYSSTTISVKLEKTVDSQLNPYSVILLTFIILVIVTILLLKKIDFFKEKDNLQKIDNLPEKKLNELQEQKKKILSAIKRVDREFEEKIISKNDYKRLRAAYKKQAIQILKEIDKLKE